MKLLVMHPFKRRRDREAVAWLEGLRIAGEGFLDRTRDETQRGGRARALVASAAWPTIAVDDATLSGRILAGVAASSRVKEMLLSAPFTHLLLLGARVEHLAALALAFARTPLLDAVILVNCTSDTLRTLSTPFGQQLWGRLEGTAREGGAKVVLLSASRREAVALGRAASLPVARAPLTAPDSDETEEPQIVLVEEAEPAPGVTGANARRLQAARNDFGSSNLGQTRALGEPALWLQYLESLGSLASGLWVKQIELDGERIPVTAWRAW